MLKNNKIDGMEISLISAMFIAKINEPLVVSLGDDFFEVHDCLHWFTGIGVSVEEEMFLSGIQKYMQGTDEFLSSEQKTYIELLKNKGVYDELCASLKEAHTNMQTRFSK